MAITKREPKRNVDSFIAAAPDAKPARFLRGHKTQITLTLSPNLLDRVDEVARRKEISRAALFTLWIGDGLAKEAA